MSSIEQLERDALMGVSNQPMPRFTGEAPNSSFSNAQNLGGHPFFGTSMPNVYGAQQPQQPTAPKQEPEPDFSWAGQAQSHKPTTAVASHPAPAPSGVVQANNPPDKGSPPKPDTQHIPYERMSYDGVFKSVTLGIEPVPVDQLQGVFNKNNMFALTAEETAAFSAGDFTGMQGIMQRVAATATATAMNILMTQLGESMPRVLEKAFSTVGNADNRSQIIAAVIGKTKIPQAMSMSIAPIVDKFLEANAGASKDAAVEAVSSFVNHHLKGMGNVQQS